MRQNREDEELDFILEGNGRNSGRRRAGSSNGNYRVIEGNRNGGARSSRDHAGLKLWTDERERDSQSARYQSRDAQMRYRKEMRRKKRRRKMLFARAVAGTALLIVLLAFAAGLWKLGSFLWNREKKADSLAAIRIEEEQVIIDDNRSEKPVIEEKFLTPNEYSRPGEALPEVTELFVHYTANAGTSAAQNRSYFENLGITGETSASAHFVIGFDGEIIQCLPLDEIGYAVKEHNYNSISIECCYLKEDGEFEDATYQSLIRLLGWLMREYDLGPSAIKRHYDSSGKLCPKYYVEHEDAWEQLIEDVEAYIS